MKSGSPNTNPEAPKRKTGPGPPGYVAGLGRGALGFITRSDIGPAKWYPDTPAFMR